MKKNKLNIDSSLKRGIACIIFSAFCFSIMNLNVRLAGDIPFTQKSFFRNIVALFFAIAIILRKQIRLNKDRKATSANKQEQNPAQKDVKQITRRTLPFLLGRSISGLIGVLCNFYAVDHLVLADASMLNKMSPFFAIIFSLIFLGEKLNFIQIAGAIAALSGCMLVIKPDFSNFASFPAIVGLCGGLGAGIAYTCVRKLSKMYVRSEIIVLFFCGFSTLATLPFIIFDYNPMTSRQFIYLLLAGLAATGGQFGVTAAYSFAPARKISVYDYSQVIFSAFLGFVFFGQIPDLLSWLGYLVIIGAAIALFFYNAKQYIRNRS